MYLAVSKFWMMVMAREWSQHVTHTLTKARRDMSKRDRCPAVTKYFSYVSCHAKFSKDGHVKSRHGTRELWHISSTIVVLCCEVWGCAVTFLDSYPLWFVRRKKKLYYYQYFVSIFDWNLESATWLQVLENITYFVLSDMLNITASHFSHHERRMLCLYTRAS